MRAALSFFSLVLVFALPTLAVDIVTFNEVYADKLVRSTEDGLASFDTVTTDSGSFRCSVHLEGLGAATLDSSTKFSVSLGAFSFSATAAQASKTTANSITFLQTVKNPDTGKTRTVGRFTFSRKGDTLNVRGSSKALDTSIAAEDFAGYAGRLTGQLDFDVQVGEFGFSGTMNFKGLGKVITRNAGGDTFELSSVRLSGSGVPRGRTGLPSGTASGATGGMTGGNGPSISFVSPRPGDVVTDDVVTVSVNATDQARIAAVSVWTNGGDPVDAFPDGSTWDSDVLLEPGTNLIQAQAVNSAGVASRVISAKVIASE